MVKFNVILVFFVILLLNLVFECQSVLSRNRCPVLRVNNGRTRTRQAGRAIRIICNPPFKLVRGNEITNCIRGEWDSELPICAQSGCPIMDKIDHGQLNVLNEGAKLEVVCDLGYTIDGPNFIYCNENFEWNEELKGCKENDQKYFLCDFESSDERFCHWRNDIFNDIDWLADKFQTFLFFGGRRHVPPGSSQYFQNNYISLDAGNYGSSTFGRLISPPIFPAKTKQKCLIFSYKVTPGISYGISTLKVSFGNIPHWATSEGEGKVIIGLYKFNDVSEITIEGKSCKAAIDNLLIADGDICAQQPYEEEIDSCHDNCGRISNGYECSCDWECHYYNNCCPDLTEKCPYIKPLEEISRLYLTTSKPTKLLKKQTTVQNNTMNATVSYLTSLKITNQSTFSNDPIRGTTPMNEHNVTIYNVTTGLTTQPIPISNITHPIYPITPPFFPTIKPITITVTIPSTTMSNEAQKKNNIFNSTLILRSTSTSLIHKDFVTPTNIEANISTITTKINNTFEPTTKIVSPNISVTLPTSINTPSSTIKPVIINTTISFIKLMNTTIKVISTNTNVMTTTSVFTNSTIKPTIINKTLSTTKQIYPHIIIKNTSINSNESNVQAISRNGVIIENKQTKNNSTTRVPHNVDNLNSSSISKNNTIVIVTLNPNSNLINSKYDMPLENKTLSLNNSSPLNTKTDTAKHSELKLKTFRKNIELTTIEVPYEKPKMNYSLQSHPVVNEGKWVTEYAKQNDNSKFPSVLSNTMNIIKYIAVIGVILITLKFTLSLIQWYFKKPINDEMNTHFIETDNVSCNMELVSSKVE